MGTSRDCRPLPLHADINYREIDAAELERALSGSGDQFSKSTVDLMIRLFDADNSKQIDRREFQILFQYIRAMRDSFESYDRAKQGHIGPEELQYALQSAQYPFTSQKTIAILFRRFEKRKTGRLTFENFLEVALYLGNWRTVFNQHDVAGEGTIRVNMEGTPFTHPCLRSLFLSICLASD